MQYQNYINLDKDSNSGAAHDLNPWFLVNYVSFFHWKFLLCFIHALESKQDKLRSKSSRYNFIYFHTLNNFFTFQFLTLNNFFIVQFLYQIVTFPILSFHSNKGDT